MNAATKQAQVSTAYDAISTGSTNELSSFNLLLYDD